MFVRSVEKSMQYPQYCPRCHHLPRVFVQGAERDQERECVRNESKEGLYSLWTMETRPDQT